MQHYKQWTEDEVVFLVENYQKYNNKVIAKKLGRTQDSIRKMMNKMHLKRVPKYKKAKAEIKKGRKSKIFSVADAFRYGKTISDKKKREKKREQNRKDKIEKERKWAKGFVSGENVPKVQKLENPVVVRVPSRRAMYEIDSKKDRSEIIAKIDAIKKKNEGHEVTIINFEL